jgi:NAD(P)H-dependent flavin oxidoreductase YrpB (nitropropane dioxygenase family)
MSDMAISNRVTAMTGTDYPIIQAPMGWIARAQLASAVSNAGGMGIIETSSGEFNNIKAEVAKISDGLSMAGAFAMGAEGVQMGTRMLSCSDSPVHDNWKQAIIQAKETDTVFLNQESRPALRALRTGRTGELATLGKFNVMEHMANLQELYFGGDMEAAIPLSGQVAGRIDAVKSAKQVVTETMAEFREIMQGLAKQYAS